VNSVSCQTDFSWDEMISKLKQEQNQTSSSSQPPPQVYVVSSHEVGEQLARLLAMDPKSIERKRKPVEKIDQEDGEQEVEYHENLHSGNLLKMVQNNNNKSRKQNRYQYSP
jgi:hypothetical protein